MKHTLEVMISEEEIAQRISELADKISTHYQQVDGELVLVGLLKGSFIFMADLCRKINVPHEVDFMTVSSYGNAMTSSRDVKIVKDLDEDIRDKHVLIVEDIIDSGNTLNKVREIFELRALNQSQFVHYLISLHVEKWMSLSSGLAIQLKTNLWLVMVSITLNSTVICLILVM